MFEAEFFSVSQELQKISGIVSARDNQDVIDPRINQCLNRVVNHRLIIDGKEGFIGHLGQWVESSPQPPRQNNPFHGSPPESLIKISYKKAGAHSSRYSKDLHKNDTSVAFSAYHREFGL